MHNALFFDNNHAHPGSPNTPADTPAAVHRRDDLVAKPADGVIADSLFGAAPAPAAVANQPLVPVRQVGYIAAVYGAPLKLLGQGTGGRVHLHRTLAVDGAEQLVAVKTFLFADSVNLDARMRHIEEEARITLQLRHPNVVRTHEYALETDGTFYCVMEYCAADLFDVVQAGAMTPAAAADLLAQLISGVAYLHRALGMAHRDLKLDNICLTADGTLKIVDFGCARQLPAAARGVTSGICGSDPYLPPEVIASPHTPYDMFRLDVWSIGIVYITMISGNFPWEKATRADANFRMYLRRGAPLIDYWVKPGGGYDGPADLIKSMLTVDGATRPTIDDVVGHPWFQRMVAASQQRG